MEATVMGQTLFDRAVRFVRRYLSLSEGQAVVMVLWAFHTWIYEKLPMSPKLVMSATTKEAGKTLSMEVLELLCRGGRQFATLRPLFLVRFIEHCGGLCTLFLDEAEKLSSGAVGDLRSIFTTSSYPGGTHGITVGSEFKLFRTHAPMMLALIGDVLDVVRSRAITLYLKRGIPAGDFRGRDKAEATAEAAEIVRGLIDYSRTVGEPLLVSPDWLTGRDREVWSALYTVAGYLRLNDATMNALDLMASDTIGAKGSKARKFYDEQAEKDTEDGFASVAVLRDLRSVFGEGEISLHTSVAVERLKAITRASWRTFEGRGLDSIVLGRLLSGVGVKPRSVRMGKGKASKVAQGYRRADVEAAIERGGL